MAISSKCTQAKVSRKAFYFWWNHNQTHGWSGLQEKPQGHPSDPGINDFLKDKVIKPQTMYEWTQKKLSVTYLARVTALTTTKLTE
jgi:hypothetical protein